MAIGKTNSYTRPGITGLVFIEPKLPRTQTNDELTRRTRALVQEHITQSRYAYRGFHTCACGVSSDNYDHFFTPPGRGKPTHITHSLLLHYVEYHRSEIPTEDLAELAKVLDLAEGKAELPQPANARDHRVFWGHPGQRPLEDNCLRRGTYDQCVEFLRNNWDRLMRSDMAQAGYQPFILTEGGRYVSFVL